MGSPVREPIPAPLEQELQQQHQRHQDQQEQRQRFGQLHGNLLRRVPDNKISRAKIEKATQMQYGNSSSLGVV